VIIFSKMLLAIKTGPVEYDIIRVVAAIVWNEDHSITTLFAFAITKTPKAVLDIFVNEQLDIFRSYVVDVIDIIPRGELSQKLENEQLMKENAEPWSLLVMICTNGGIIRIAVLDVKEQPSNTTLLVYESWSWIAINGTCEVRANEQRENSNRVGTWSEKRTELAWDEAEIFTKLTSTNLKV
jgi:hypothetical protein